MGLVLLIVLFLSVSFESTSGAPGGLSTFSAASSVWQVKCTGWSWEIVVPVAILAVWVLVRLHRRELESVAPRLAKRLLVLRAAALALLVLLFMEPTLARRTSQRVLPLVAVVVDQSGSMAVKDELMAPGAKLAEAIGLELLPASSRPLKTNAAEQAASDGAIVGDAKQGSAVAQALAALAAFSRYERAVKLAQLRVLPALEGKARVRVFGMDTGLGPLDLDQPARLLPNRATDFESCLAALARNWAQEYVGGVILLSDGRQTAGADLAPVLRSLRARGALVSAIMVGDPGVPPDAVVAELSGSGEVFLGETVPLTVRYRITGAEDLDWDLVLTRQGKELARRAVRGNDQWQYEIFTFAATNAGINVYQARLELAREQNIASPLSASGSVDLELWNEVVGTQVAEWVKGARYRKPPNFKSTLDELAYKNRGEQYGARIRGYLVPPQSGNYVFSISSDDGSELWVSPTAYAKDKAKVASVAGYVPPGAWDAQPSQNSQPITLKAHRPYYFETLHKQGSGEDHFAVGWRLPDGTLERPIPSGRLASYDESAATRLAALKRQTAQLKTNRWQEASLANNSAEFAVAVNQDPIKVLLVDSTPRWESRYLAALFERDRRVNFTRRYHSVVFEDKSVTLLPRTQAEWDACDMVCLGDLDGNELPLEQQKLAANFVARRGGFLVCLAGPRGMPKAFSLGPFADLLPVRLSLGSSQNSAPVTVTLTPAGADYPMMQVLNEAGYNRELWPLLPPLQWIADGVLAKPGAAVLLTAQNPSRTPIIAAQRFGAGRVLWVGTEETWRWRDRLGERVHQTFWLQTMRWGLAGRLRGADPRLQVGLDRYLMSCSETAELRARVSLPNGEAVREPPLVKLEKLGDNGEPVPTATRLSEMLPMADTSGIWQLALKDLDEGAWRITVAHPQTEPKGLREVRELMVRNLTAQEGLDLSGDLPGLTRLTSLGGHKAGSVDQTPAVLHDFASRLTPRLQEHQETIRLWNSYWSILAVAALLCAEWVLRKRHGLP